MLYYRLNFHCPTNLWEILGVCRRCMFVFSICYSPFLRRSLCLCQ